MRFCFSEHLDDATFWPLFRVGTIAKCSECESTLSVMSKEPSFERGVLRSSSVALAV